MDNIVKDLAERTVATYVQAFAGLLIAANAGVEQLNDLSVVKTCAVAAIPAGLAVVKGVFASFGPFGDFSASLVNAGYEKLKIVEVPAKRQTVKKAAAKKPAVKKKAV